MLLLVLQLPSSYYLMQRNLFEVFKPIYSILNIFTRLKKNKLSFEDTNKTFFAANNCFPSHLIEQEPRKTATRHPVSDCLEIKGLGIYIAKESPPPSSRKFTRVP